MGLYAIKPEIAVKNLLDRQQTGGQDNFCKWLAFWIQKYSQEVRTDVKKDLEDLILPGSADQTRITKLEELHDLKAIDEQSINLGLKEMKSRSDDKEVDSSNSWLDYILSYQLGNFFDKSHEVIAEAISEINHHAIQLSLKIAENNHELLKIPRKFLLDKLIDRLDTGHRKANTKIDFIPAFISADYRSLKALKARLEERAIQRANNEFIDLILTAATDGNGAEKLVTDLLKVNYNVNPQFEGMRVGALMGEIINLRGKYSIVVNAIKNKDQIDLKLTEPLISGIRMYLEYEVLTGGNKDRFMALLKSEVLDKNEALPEIKEVCSYLYRLGNLDKETDPKHLREECIRFITDPEYRDNYLLATIAVSIVHKLDGNLNDLIALGDRVQNLDVADLIGISPIMEADAREEGFID